MRNFIVIISLLIAIGSIFASYRYGKNSSTAKSELNTERYLRMTAEEELSKSQNKVNSLEFELTRANNKSETLTKKIEQLTTVNSDYRTRLDAANQQIGNLQEKVVNVDTSAPQDAIEAAINGGT